MNINTGKLASSSTSFLKKIKEIDTGRDVSKINKKTDTNISSKLLKDFPEIKNTNQTFKTRLVNISSLLSNYENELSKTQFIDERLKEIEKEIQENNKEKIKSIIQNSTYNNEKVLSKYFDNNKDVPEQLQIAKQNIEKQYSSLKNEFKAIEITSQNIISLYSYPMNISEASIKNLNINELAKSTNLNQKRVIDLIS